MLAALNRPSIAAICGLEPSSSVTGLVMELIFVETLAEQVKSGPIPIEEALKIGVQIAEALDAVNEKSTTHRDLKPANVKVATEGKRESIGFWRKRSRAMR
jgi:serine/threonine protein kinase